ncbi:hypothetical protein C5L14_13955 [Labrys okinawensis]|uniref:Phage shock protein A n=1 Tax=Labrys okinawensis TaxID=346911 RepID=A0A2S9QAT6_9HYPH|nr:PspA/IM30 family protein [Labrys okinawensis]PRH86445.1 hypothetical protein C5L14_13955 [Labrys okinawensis]
MFKTIVTLFRGAAAEAQDNLAGRNAVRILDQQIRDARAGLEQGRRALAVAIAQDRAEARRLGDVRRRIADLDERAIEALRGGRDDLAGEAAVEIANLENDTAAIAAAQATFAEEAARLRTKLAAAERRFLEIERGRRITAAAEIVNKLKSGYAAAAPGTALADAEKTLARLRERQTHQDDVDLELEVLDAEARSAAATERLEAAGFGPPTRTTAQDVLARLKTRAAQAA